MDKKDKQIRKLKRVLKSLEWHAGEYDTGCCICGRTEHEGHSANCKLKKALA